jgi:hypothetical protein
MSDGENGNGLGTPVRDPSGEGEEIDICRFCKATLDDIEHKCTINADNCAVCNSDMHTHRFCPYYTPKTPYMARRRKALSGERNLDAIAFPDLYKISMVGSPSTNSSPADEQREARRLQKVQDQKQRSGRRKDLVANGPKLSFTNSSCPLKLGAFLMIYEQLQADGNYFDCMDVAALKCISVPMVSNVLRESKNSVIDFHVNRPTWSGAVAACFEKVHGHNWPNIFSSWHEQFADKTKITLTYVEVTTSDFSQMKEVARWVFGHAPNYNNPIDGYNLYSNYLKAFPAGLANKARAQFAVVKTTPDVGDVKQVLLSLLKLSDNADILSDSANSSTRDGRKPNKPKSQQRMPAATPATPPVWSPYHMPPVPPAWPQYPAMSMWPGYRAVPPPGTPSAPPPATPPPGPPPTPPPTTTSRACFKCKNGVVHALRSQCPHFTCFRCNKAAPGHYAAQCPLN